MTHEGKADFNGFVPQKNRRRKKLFAANKIPDIVFQAENIVSAFATQKSIPQKRKSPHKFLLFATAAIIIFALSAVFAKAI